MTNYYRIKEGVKPYPGKLLKAKADPDNMGTVWGHVMITNTRTSGLKGYPLTDLILERKEP